MPDAHAAHRTAFALSLRPIAPALAALHAAHLRQHADSPLTCARCGAAAVHTRSARRGVERTCGACAHVERVPVARGGAAPFKRTRRRVGAPSTASTAASTPAPGPSAPARAPSAPSTPSPAASPAPALKRSKKKSGLQELLARNRERQAQQQRAPAGGGLSSFLGGL